MYSHYQGVGSVSVVVFDGVNIAGSAGSMHVVLEMTFAQLLQPFSLANQQGQAQASLQSQVITQLLLTRDHSALLVLGHGGAQEPPIGVLDLSDISAAVTSLIFVSLFFLSSSFLVVCSGFFFFNCGDRIVETWNMHLQTCISHSFKHTLTYRQTCMHTSKHTNMHTYTGIKISRSSQLRVPYVRRQILSLPS